MCTSALLEQCSQSQLSKQQGFASSTRGYPAHISHFRHIHLEHHNYTDGPCGLQKFWIWSLAFQKYTDGPSGFHFVTHLVPNLFFQKYMEGPRGLHFVTHLVPTCFNL
ncbi:hypothetical protein Hanom_Chr17g01540411 [Helianthus anomalus]